MKKLTARDVETCRIVYQKGTYKQAELAEAYEVTQGTMSRALSGETWEHVRGPVSGVRWGMPLSAEDKKTLVLLYLNDKRPLKDIAAALGCSLSTIYSAVHEFLPNGPNREMGRPEGRLTDIRKQQIRELYKTGAFSQRRLAKAFQVSKTTVFTVCHE